jgi:DNA-binding beta-propeller fold protein YncE
LLSGALAAAQPPGPHYHVSARHVIGGNETGYDYVSVDPATRRVFVAHGTRLEVLAADGGERLGQIEGLVVAHGIEFPEGLGRGFATSGNDRTVLMFDPRTLKVLKAIRYAGVKPDALKYDPSSRLLFVVNGGSTGDITVIDPRNAAIVATIDLGGGKLEQIAFDGRGRGYINDEKRNLVHVIDTNTLSAVTTWPLAPGEEPTGLAIDPAARRIFAACGNDRLVSVDIDSGRVVSTAPIGADPDGAVFDPKSGRIFVSNRDGTLSVIREEAGGRLHPDQTVQTASGARTIALDEKTGQLFLPYADFAPAPAPTPSEPKPRPQMVPGSFGVLVVAP